MSDPTYTELAELVDNLGLILREARRARGLSLRVAGNLIGIDFNTLGRIERGDADVRSSNIPLIFRWLDQTAPIPEAQLDGGDAHDQQETR